MPYTVTYPGDSCDELIPAHSCSPCDETEKARVRDVAYVNESYAATLAADPTDATLWTDGIQSGQIRIIAGVSGDYDGGAKVTGPGYGNLKERITGRNNTLKYNDPNYAENCDFYTALEKSSRWYGAWKTETMVHLTDKPVTVFAKNPVENNVESDVVWDVEWTWFQKSPVCPHDAPDGVFACFSLT